MQLLVGTANEIRLPPSDVVRFVDGFPVILVACAAQRVFDLFPTSDTAHVRGVTMATTQILGLKRAQLCHEHGELEAMVATLFRVFTERHETPRRVAQLLENLLERVAAHFKDEEAAGLFQDLTRRMPQHAGEIETLRSQHDQLLENLVKLNRVAANGELIAETWAELEHNFRNLTTELCHHEARENELLQLAYDDDIGSHD